MPRINLPTDVTLDFLDIGPRDGKPIILLHGWTDSWRIWESSFPYFSKDLRIICPTHRGFGDSSKPSDGYSMGHFVKDYEAFVECLGISKCVIGGHSMGGFIAHHFAINNPSLLSHLILIGTGTTGYNKPAFTNEAIGLDSFPDPMTLKFAREAQENGMRLRPSEQILNNIVFESTKSPTFVWKLTWAAMQSENHSNLLNDIKVPTLIQCGDDDIYFPISEQLELSKAITNSTLKLYPGAGHGLQWELPEQFAQDISDFVLNN